MLFAITAVSAGILAVVNSITNPIITANAELKRKKAMEKVLPNAEEFVKIDFNDEASSVVEVYDAGDSGFVILCEPKGYSDTISLVVGINQNLTVNSIDITEHSETPGLGANCVKEEFLQAFAGKTQGVKAVKSSATGNQIDALSSATITSKAVVKGVNDALAVAERLTGGKK